MQNNNENTPKKAVDSQVGGNHYKGIPLQPYVAMCMMGMGYEYTIGNIVKYITRHRKKNGREDIQKVAHYCRLASELGVPDPVDYNKGKCRTWAVLKFYCEINHLEPWEDVVIRSLSTGTWHEIEVYVNSKIDEIYPKN